MTARLLLIALDGADSNLIDRWSLDGTLPNIGALRARGAAHHIAAPDGATDDMLWANFQYACGLGEHGRFNYMQRLSDGRMAMAILDETDRERFWDGLSASGKRIAILDIPKTAAPRPINGIHLADWLVHGRYFRKPRSYPKELAREVVGNFGAAPKSYCDFHVDRDDAVRREQRDNLLRSAAMKERAGLDFLKREPWDFFAIAFKEGHCAGHNFWDLTDPAHPEFDSALNDRLGDPVRTIIKRLDAAVGKLVETAGLQAQVLLFSTTKMEPNASVGHFEPHMERHLNLALAESRLSGAVRRLLKRSAPIEIMPYNENCTAIRVNRDGQAREALLQDIESVFQDLSDAETGERLTDRVLHPNRDYPGARAHQLPDLLVCYRAGHIPTSIESPRIGRIEAAAPTYRSGNHACGPFIIGAGIDVSGIARLEDIGGVVCRGLSGKPAL